MNSKEKSILSEEIPSDLLKDRDFSVVFLESGKVIDRETPVLIDNPYEFEFHRLSPASGAMHLERFFEIAAELIEFAQEQAGVVESRRVKFVSDFPNEDFDLFGNEVITYTVKRRYPANMNSSGDGRAQYGPSFHSARQSPESPNKVFIVEHTPIDHIISITCWGSTADLAERRANWLEALFKSHKSVFTIQGVDRMVWQGRTANTVWIPRQQRIHQRSHDFLVRLYEFEIREHPMIREFVLKAKVS